MAKRPPRSSSTAARVAGAAVAMAAADAATARAAAAREVAVGAPAEPGAGRAEGGGAAAASGRSAHAAEHGMHLEPRTRQEVVTRLRSAKGHLEGVLRMLDDPSVYCVDVLKQVKAVQGALTKVNDAVLRSHIRDHVVTAAQRGDADVIVEELMEALKYRA